MNLNIYINDELAKQLDLIAITNHKKRNTLIQEAISVLVQNYNKKKWPDSITNFQGFKDLTAGERFETHRQELAEPNSDIFRTI